MEKNIERGDLFMEKPWRKLSCIVLVVGLCVTTHFGSVYAQTTDFNDSQITEKTYIDPDIYQMIMKEALLLKEMKTKI